MAKSFLAQRQRSGQPASLPNFDRVARVYRWAEYLCLGLTLQRVRLHFLSKIRHSRHVLALGDGDGRFLARFLRSAPEAQAMAVDASATMLALLQRRCCFATSRLTLYEGDLLDLRIDMGAVAPDLIISHFALDCLAQRDVERLAARVASVASPGALWVVSDFALPQRQPWRVFARWYIRALYLAFRVLTGLRVQALPDISAALRGTGFARLERAEWLKGLLFSELWQVTPSEASEYIRATSTPGTSSTHL